MTKKGEVVRHSDILRRAFWRFVAEDHIDEAEWPKHARQIIWSVTGKEHIDPALLDWIVRK